MEIVAFVHAFVANDRIVYVESGCSGASQNVQADKSVKSRSCSRTVTRRRTLLLLPSLNDAVIA